MCGGGVVVVMYETRGRLVTLLNVVVVVVVVVLREVCLGFNSQPTCYLGFSVELNGVNAYSNLLLYLNVESQL